MALRSVNDRLGGHTSLVDSMIGNAYETVRRVACYLQEIAFVAANMDTIVNVSTKADVTLIAATEASSLVTALASAAAVSATEAASAAYAATANATVAGFNAQYLSWLESLPTVLPTTPGVLWNNGGTPCKS